MLEAMAPIPRRTRRSSKTHSRWLHQGSGGADERPVAVIIWEGQARAGTDATEEFRQRAEAAGLTFGRSLRFEKESRPQQCLSRKSRSPRLSINPVRNASHFDR